MRRTWAPRGETPVIKLSEPHGRISVIAAITISPVRRKFAFYFRLLADNANFYGSLVARFIEDVHRTASQPHHSRMGWNPNSLCEACKKLPCCAAEELLSLSDPCTGTEPSGLCMGLRKVQSMPITRLVVSMNFARRSRRSFADYRNDRAFWNRSSTKQNLALGRSEPTFPDYEDQAGVESEGLSWWTWRGSNPRPHDCQACQSCTRC